MNNQFGSPGDEMRTGGGSGRSLLFLLLLAAIVAVLAGLVLQAT